MPPASLLCWCHTPAPALLLALVFLSVSSVHWRLVLRTQGWVTPVTGYQLSRGVWTKTPATWSEHLCAQGGADGPGPANCGGSGDCWSGLELELGCCVKVVWPGCCCLCPLAATALLYCTVTLHRDIIVPLAICNLLYCLSTSTVSCSDDVLESLHFFLSWLFLYLNIW